MRLRKNIVSAFKTEATASESISLVILFTWDVNIRSNESVL